MVSPFTGLAMENYIGSRARIGVIIPSTNTAVEYDLQKINLPGVTWHPGRFFVEAPNLQSDDAFIHFLELIRQESVCPGSHVSTSRVFPNESLPVLPR